MRVLIAAIAWALVFFTFVILATLLLFAAQVRAHSWYPNECCSGTDCEMVPIEGVQEVAGGYRVRYWSKNWNQFADMKFGHGLVKPSQDFNYHACWKPCPTCEDGETEICFFVPMNVRWYGPPIPAMSHMEAALRIRE